MPLNRKFRVKYTIPGQNLQVIDVQASDLNAARSIVQSMFGPKTLIGFIEEIR
jgi:tRNA threonylcarbamoyladenosine modification (KEOPS) complex  Pcc1 subunit